MSDIHLMKKPWSVVGAGFNDEGVYFIFDDWVIHRDDINLMQAAPELLEVCLRIQAQFRQAGIESKAGSMNPAEDSAAQIDAVILKALGQQPLQEVEDGAGSVHKASC